MVKAYKKTVFRTIKNHFSRFLAMIAIVALGVGFVTGLSATSPNMKDTVNQYFIENAVPDIIVKAASPLGITEKQLSLLQDDPLVESAQDFFSMDTKLSIDAQTEELNTRVYYLSLQNQSLNKISLISGDWPQNKNEVLIERASEHLKQIEIGENIVYNGELLKIVGITQNPLYFSTQKMQSAIENEYLEMIVYIDNELNPSPPLITDVYLKIIPSGHKNIFSSEYERYIDERVSSLKVISGDENPLVFLTFKENESVALYKNHLDKIEAISFIFPVFFILIAALVVLTTMSRLIEEERTVIGGYKTLGYNSGRILFKYIFYALLCGITGSLLGIAAGFRLLPMLIYSIFTNLFHIPPLTVGFFFSFGLIAAVIMILVLVAVTWYVIAKTLKEKPAELLKQKAPKQGKKVFLEKIPFIWKRLKFKYKSTFRNVFRYMKHFVMTVVSVAGCMALVLAGFGLYDSIKGTDLAQFADPSLVSGVIDSVVSVSILVIAAAGVLSLVVIYNLTNMNIEERKKEIATLKVLGYKTVEVAGYIFREVFVLTCFGIIAGLPLGYVLLRFILAYMDSDAFRLILNINWYSWLLSIAVTILFTVIVDILLYRKIAKVDMNASLKSNE